ncbi:MAG: NAD-dependent DNA ligase LigA [Firmicutes bacterium]|nr:NAD-dependent DNA ligase LigA [Bacillota bacterium]
MDKNIRMQQLVAALNKYAYEYYVLDNPSVSDQYYDKLYDELVSLEKDTGVIFDDSPTKRVGGDVLDGFKQHAHKARLYSLDKCKSDGEFFDWIGRVKKLTDLEEFELSLEYKLDGVTIVLTYENGNLIKAATRGDGVIGEDVTVQVLTVKSVPLSIEYKGFVEIQGEGIMRLSAFEKYNATADIPLKNPRNGAAGGFRNLDPKITAKRNLDIVFYNINYIEIDLKNQKGMWEFLNRNKFKTLGLFLNQKTSAIIENVQNIDRNKLDFLIDGMVIKVSDLSLRDKLGYTDKFPRWAIAYKFEAEEADTVLEEVVWNVGRTGKLTPLAFLTPIELGGVTVKRATLNNYGDILRKKVRIGSRVFIRRSNDVIPEILGIVDESVDIQTQEIIKPAICPACDTSLLEKGAHIFCPNTKNCPPQIQSMLEHFVSKDCMDIEGISSSGIQSLNEILKINSPIQLYFLTEDDISKLDGFKDKKIKNLLKSIETSKNTSLDRFINALGIPNVGKKLARDLAKKYSSIDNLIKADLEELNATQDIGEITASGIIEYFNENKNLIDEFKKIGINPIDNSASKTGIFANRNIVITGVLHEFSRQQAFKLIEDNGGNIQSAISKTTDILIAGEKAGSKLKKAKELDIRIIDEQEFINLLKGD